MKSFLAKIQSQGKITVPYNLREILELSKGTFIELEIVRIHQKQILTKK